MVRVLGDQDPQRERFVTAVLTELPADPAVIAHRVSVVENLLDEPDLRESLASLLPQLSLLVRERRRPLYRDAWTVDEIVHRLAELELYVEVSEGLARALDPHMLSAPGLTALQASMQALAESTEFESLRTELPALLAQLEGMQSITIGVNLSRDLRPESATILSIDAEKVEGRRSLLGRLLGQGSAGRGITRLRGEPRGPVGTFFPPMGGESRGRDNDLVRDLRLLIERVMAPVGEAIERFLWAKSRDFAALESELAFLLNGVALIARLRGAGLPVCRPEIASVDERMCQMEGGYNVSLALRMISAAAKDGGKAGEIVTNPIRFDPVQGQVWILTGPNRSGKTTYVRAVGLAQLLFQAGLYVPADCARMSPIDALFTHFPGTETAVPGRGRLDEEAARLAEIFAEATPNSLILLNEVLSGTSTVEGLALAHDAVRGLRLLGARAIYVTHLHELATRVEQINATTPGAATVGSLVAQVEADGDAPGGAGEAVGSATSPTRSGYPTVTPGVIVAPGEMSHRRTFRIRPGPPLGLSYASEIAEQHGISFPQLVHLLQSRGLI